MATHLSKLKKRNGDIILPVTRSEGVILDDGSTDLQTKLDSLDSTNLLKAPLNNPTFTGNVSGISATMVGLGNVTNESKSTMFTNPTFTGTPISTTASVGTNTTQIATTAFVNSEIENDATLKSLVTGTLVNYIWSGTQAQYDAISTKDTNTLYFIVG